MICVLSAGVAVLAGCSSSQARPHWVCIAQHLEGSKLYREFRTGDLSLEIWSESEAFRKRFGDALEFLYY